MVDPDLVGPVYAAYSFQRIANEINLGFKLCLVGDVLKLASTALAEILARRLAARGRWLKYLIDHRAREVLFALGYLDSQALAGRSQGNEDRESVVPRYGVASIS